MIVLIDENRRMIMRKKIAAGLLILALAVSTAACSQDTEPADNNAPVEESAQTEKNEQSASDQAIVTDNVTTAEKLTVMGDEIDMEMTYPKVSGLDDKLIEERVNMTIRQAFRTEHALLSGEANVIETSFDVTHLSDQWISIRFDFTTDPTGDGKNTYDLFTSFTVDMTTGEPILFHNLWTELSSEEQEAFTSALDGAMMEGQVNPITGPESFPEAYINGQEFVVYYYDNEMHELKMPLADAEGLLIK